MIKNVSPITFIDKLVKKNELGQPFRLSDHQREVLRLAFAFDQDGRLPWDTILYSCIKKSGKTTLNGAITLAWGFTQEAPNEMLVLANDLEQTLARVFKTMEGIIQHNPELQREAEVQTRTIYLANGTTVTAISGDYAGAAGSDHGFVSYDELWGYTSESSTRLWEELTPVPTRKNSISFISTYAGFEGESGLLWDLYKQVVSKDEHPEGQGERLSRAADAHVSQSRAALQQSLSRFRRRGRRVGRQRPDRRAHVGRPRRPRRESGAHSAAFAVRDGEHGRRRRGQADLDGRR